MLELAKTSPKSSWKVDDTHTHKSPGLQILQTFPLIMQNWFLKVDSFLFIFHGLSCIHILSKVIGKETVPLCSGRNDNHGDDPR